MNHLIYFVFRKHINDSIQQKKKDELIEKLTKENFILKRKLEEKNESHFKTNFNIINSDNILEMVFDNIRHHYVINESPQYLEKIKSKSLKKMYKLKIGSNIYLFTDFTNSNELSEDFITVTNYFADGIYCLPKICYHKGHIVISEYIDNSINVESVDKILLQSINWIINFKQSGFKSENTLKNAYVGSINKLLNYSTNVKINNLKKIEQLIDDLYLRPICPAHNDFNITNVLWSESEQCIKIINYQNCSNNLEHYDIVSLLYSLEATISDTDRKKWFDYYYEKLNCPCNYSQFMLTIMKTAFVRICVLLESRIEKLIKGNPYLLLTTEISVGLSYLNQIENYIGFETNLSTNLNIKLK